MDGKNIDKNTRVVDTLALRRTAKEAKRYVVLMRLLKILAIILIAIVAAAYAVSYFYDKYGSFTVKISKYDMIDQGLTLSETPDYTTSNSRLNADILYDMTNISGEDLPDNIDKINGSHNGEGYIAYTFYLIHEKLHSDEAIRVELFVNGEKTVYGKTKSDGSGKESDCDKEFASSTEVMKDRREKLGPGEKDKYTVVIWLEGNDPDCVDKIIGGTMKLGMNFKIVETT